MFIIALIFAILGVVFLATSCSVAYKAKEKNDKDSKVYLKMGIIGFLVLMLISVGSLWAIPMYKVWQKGKDGEAALAEATANRQILIQEAAAQEEAAKHTAEAEICSAIGTSKANEIIGSSLNKYPLCLQYLYIRSLEKTSNRVIYVPISNSALPILEASRLIEENEVISGEK